jgi:RNA polymerase sigma-70 factor, ECF subfamily
MFCILDRMQADPGEVTLLVRRVRSGEALAENQLAELIYDQIRRLAAAKMRKERADHTLTPTALANEAWMRLRGSGSEDIKDRQHFFAIAANAMRRVLIDHARTKAAAKREGVAVSIEEINLTAPQSDEQLVALDDALHELAAVNARAARVIELQFFGGLKQQEIAELLSVDRRTVVRDWNMARAWLYRRISNVENSPRDSR